MMIADDDHDAMNDDRPTGIIPVRIGRSMIAGWAPIDEHIIIP